MLRERVLSVVIRFLLNDFELLTRPTLHLIYHYSLQELEMTTLQMMPKEQQEELELELMHVVE